MLPLLALLVFSLLSKNSAEQWLMNYKYDTDSAEEGNMNNFKIDDYNNYDFDDYESDWNPENTDSLEIREILKGYTRTNKQGCSEEISELHDVPLRSNRHSIYDDIYPKKYRNITCVPAHEKSNMVVYPLCHMYNPRCETEHREVRIFKKYPGKSCWKHIDTFYRQNGCRCF
ncbi:uncharacterized protein LOC123013355 [Tribolium madens]|uniref:uncharacterized protein LOC123013355 n=1 Tax=Tribolium madens TaxID=41895 RepID=UPI001CF72E59|nr:uncharacterized protein LOC123013355 [Tribolium madens]